MVYYQKTKRKKRLIYVLVLLALASLGAFFLFFRKKENIVIEKRTEPAIEKEVPYSPPANASKITELPCENNARRPFAIMYSGDRSARKYFSNLSLADFVLEMPHRAVHGQPRLMGIFQCATPEIVGPMRSGRVDHISVATSFDAIYVPWGGSSIGKGLLKRGVIDHIDCNGEVYPGGEFACFRREGPMSQLEKASTSVPKLLQRAEQLKYRMEWRGTGFDHQADAPEKDRPEFAKVKVGFEAPSNVEYIYDRKNNAYLRSFDGGPDIDFETKKQYAPKNLIVILTEKEPWLVEKDYTALGVQDPWAGIDEEHKKNDNGQYPNLQLGDPWFDTKREGEARFYFNGKQIIGKWKRKKGAENPFEFFGDRGEKIKFVPGQIWMHVLENYQTVIFEDKKTEESIKATEETAAPSSN